jgi:hypothetical protein
MAKMFYTLDEAAAKLRRSQNEVRDLVATGHLQEFRDREKLVFKVEQVDLLAYEDDGNIPLADSGEHSISLTSDSGSGLNLESPKEQSGISIFDADDTEKAEPSAQTKITQTGTGGTDFSADAGGSGSGLMDMTREVDDTSLGADLLDDAYKNQPAGGALFESTGADSDVSAGAAPTIVAMHDDLDGPWSGIAGGLTLAMIAGLGLAMVVIIGAMFGGMTPLVNMVAGNHMAFIGGLAGVLVVFAIIGWLMGRNA